VKKKLEAVHQVCSLHDSLAAIQVCKNDGPHSPNLNPEIAFIAYMLQSSSNCLINTHTSKLRLYK